MFVDIQQNTDEWLEMRGGKITSSGVSKIMANLSKKNRPFGGPAKQYAVKIALEQITGKAISGNFANSHMDRGHLEEPIDRVLYEELNFCEVTNGGFFDNGNTGDSPDGLIYHDGVAEIKSVLGHVQYEVVKKGIFQSAYKWQLVWHLQETGRDWVDYISYSGEFPEGNQLFIYRADRDYFANELEMVQDRVGEFFYLVDECKDQIRGGCDVKEIEFTPSPKKITVKKDPKVKSISAALEPAGEVVETTELLTVQDQHDQADDVNEYFDSPDVAECFTDKDAVAEIENEILSDIVEDNIQNAMVACPEAGGMMVEVGTCDGQSCRPGCPAYKD